MAEPAFLQNDRRREAQTQTRLLDALESRFRRRLARILAQVSAEMLAVYERTGTVPPLPENAARRIADEYEALALASARVFGVRILGQGKALGLIETKDEHDGGVFAAFFRRLAEQWVSLEAIRQRITWVTQTTRDQIVSMVRRGQEDGLSVDAIAKSINERVPTISRWRGALIARTETHGAANYSMHETAKSTGMTLVKEWNAAEDHRTRAIPRGDAFDHLAMDGQKRDMDQPFDMPWISGGGEPLKIMFPGEAGHPGAATINCRCVVTHSVKRPS